VKAIMEWPTPKNVEQVQSYVGTVGYYRKFIKDFAKKSAPLTQLFKKGVDWQWKHAQENAFNELKRAISNPPVLKTPDYSKEFSISSDASGTGIGGVVSQKDENGKERPIAYFSRQLNEQEKNWSIYEQETLALVESLKKFRHYVEGNKVNLFTDHKALIYLNNQPKLTLRIKLDGYPT